jgi:hypothetical protein
LALRVKNWHRFQHFKDRRPPWIKLYRDILDDPDWHDLDSEASKALVMLWLIASEDDGRLPDTKKIAFRLRISEQKTKSLIGKLSHWLEQDDISAISDRHQSDAPETETETETETYKEETEKGTERVSRLAVIPEGLDPKVWQDFLAIRKAKRSPLTQTALEGIRREALKAGVSLEAGLRTCCERGWQSLKAEWIGGTTEPDYSELIARLKD